MDSSSFTPYILLLLILLSAMFSASETALFSLGHAKVEAMKVNKVRGAQMIARLKSNPQKLLVIILVGNNFVNTAATAIATIYFTQIFESNSIGFVTGIMTLAILVFGEVMPKSFAAKHCEKISQILVYPLTFIEYVLYPLVWIFEKVLKLIVGENINTVTEDEVKAMVSMGAEAGSLEKHEQEFIENVLEFNDLEAGQIMTPRTEIKALESTVSINEAIQYAIETQYSRIPVFVDNLDNIIGFVTLKKLLQFESKNSGRKTLNDVNLFEFIKIPPTTTIYALFLEFKKKRTHIALVYDQHGGVEGIITMEDILEEIVGDMEDETDKKETPIIALNQDSLMLNGDVELEDLEKALDCEMPSYDNKDTINWVIIDFLERFPSKGEVVVIDGIKLIVEDMDPNTGKINRVKAVKL